MVVMVTKQKYNAVKYDVSSTNMNILAPINNKHNKKVVAIPTVEVGENNKSKIFLMMYL